MAASKAVIERIDTFVVRVPLRRPVADSIYERTHWHIPVVQVSTSEGLVGTGYSGVWTGEDLLLDTIDRYLAPMLLGRDARDIGMLWREMYWSALHWVGRAGVTHMALGMIDIALWDAAAQRAEQPLWRLLGGTHAQLQTYNTDGGWLNLTVDELLEDMATTVDAGWRRIKMKVGGPDPAIDLARIRAVRDSLPDDVMLMVDVNQRWDLVTASGMLPALADLGVAWLEEPLHPDDIAGHARLARSGTVPVALGENIYSLEAFAGFLAADAVDIVQVDVTRVGGITEWLRIAQAARARSRWVVPHAGDMMQLHQHLVGGVGADAPVMIEYLPWGLEVFDEPVSMSGNLLSLPDAPGASSAISSEARRRWGTER